MNRREVMMSAGLGAGLARGPSDAPTGRSSRRREGVVERPDGTRLFYRDWGEGRPIVFVHAWALPSPMWDYQVVDLCAAGFRCVVYDRRGHGRSSAPYGGYDFDSLADDLAAVIEHTGLNDVILVGHSMGAGELTRYATRHGEARIGGLVYSAPAATPFPTRTADNPLGVPAEQFEGFRTQVLMRDFPSWLDANREPFFIPSTSRRMQEWIANLMMTTPVHVAVECNRSGVGTDFRRDLPRIKSRTLVIHGDKDASAPVELGRATAALIPGAKFILYEDAPHGLFLTHMQRLNTDLKVFASA